METVIIVLILAAVISLGCWILSLVTKDYSWVDRVWSLAPIVYCWIYTVPLLYDDVISTVGMRTLLLTLAVTAWGARLTFNLWRKGGYSGAQDYRWAIVRQQMKPWQWQVFNLIFISIYQNALLVLLTFPVALSSQLPSSMTFLDVVLLALFAFALIGETVADQQQWDFQKAKKEAKGRLEPGFTYTGLYRYSRHPNYFFEQVQWWLIYCIGANGAFESGVIDGFTRGALNWTLLGAFLLSFLFLISTMFTEMISSEKYPAYAQYKEVTSRQIPLPQRKPKNNKQKKV